VLGYLTMPAANTLMSLLLSWLVACHIVYHQCISSCNTNAFASFEFWKSVSIDKITGKSMVTFLLTVLFYVSYDHFVFAAVWVSCVMFSSEPSQEIGCDGRMCQKWSVLSVLDTFAVGG